MNERSATWTSAGWLLVAAAFVVGFLNYPMQVVGSRLEQLPGDIIDNRLNNFVLEHGYRWLTGKAGADFWDAPLFYAMPGATSFSDAHIGMLPVYAAARLVGATPEGAFQWHFLMSCALNFAAAVWALRRLGFGPAGAAAAAYIFAFGLSIVAQTQHTQLFPRFLVPIAVVFGWEFLYRPTTWRLAAVAWCAAGQLYLTVYIGYFLGLVLAVGFVVALARYGRGFAWRELLRPGWRAWAGRVAVVATAAFAANYLLAHHGRGSRGGVPMATIKADAPVWASWLTPPKNAYLHPAGEWSPLRDYKPPAGEHIMCPGLVPIAAALLVAPLVFFAAPAGGTRRPAVVAAWTALLLGAVVTRFGDFWAYGALDWLPGVGGIRVPGRICLVLPLLGGVAFAYLLDAAVGLARRLGIVPAAVVAVAGVGVAALDQRLIPVEGHADQWFFFRTSAADIVAKQQRIAEAVRRHPAPGYVYAFPPPGADYFGKLIFNVDVMRATQDLGVPCVNGWSGYVPPGWNFFVNYRELHDWLIGVCGLQSKDLHGLVIVGVPGPPNAKDDQLEAHLRATFPPQPLPLP